MLAAAARDISLMRVKPNGTRSLVMYDKRITLQSEFNALAKVENQPEDMDEIEWLRRKVSTFEKKEFFQTFALLLVTTTGQDLINLKNSNYEDLDIEFLQQI